MQNKPSRVAEILAAAAAARGDAPLVEFRDENERLDFSIEMSVIDMRANLWKIDEYLKLLERLTDRRSGAAGTRAFTLAPSPLALSPRPHE
jgi:hypothetical protein